jgi:hypothetical protein
MLPKLSDEILGACVDRELDPAIRHDIEAAARHYPEIGNRLRVIRRVTILVRMAYSEQLRME